MDRLDRMTLFVRIVERGSFTQAAADLGLARSTATAAIKALEAELGVRLLERSTRHVAATPDGRAWFERATALLADFEEAHAVFGGTEARGLVRLDAPGLLTQTFIMPRLPEFLTRHPGLSLHFGQTDRLVDLVRDGVDCAIRAGELEDSALIRRRLGMMAEATCASAAYVAARGRPASLDDLAGHEAVGFISSRTREAMPLEFSTPAGLEIRRLPSRVTADDTNTAAALARAGFGLIQAPRYRFAAELAAGTMVELLPDMPPPPLPLNALHPPNRQLSRRLRLVLDWLGEVFAELR